MATRCGRPFDLAGTPRPALVVESDLVTPTHASVTICPITSDCIDAPMRRILLPPGDCTGLPVLSQVMADKVVSVPRDRAHHHDAGELSAIDPALRLWLSL